MKTPNFKLLKKYLLPLLIIILASTFLRFIKDSGTNKNIYFLMTLLNCLMCFLFGLSLRLGRKKRRQNLISKLMIGLVMIYLLIYQLDILSLPKTTSLFNYLGLTKLNLSLLYIYFGWLFFD